MKTYRLQTISLLAVLSLAACQATKVQSIKKEPEFAAKNMRNALVIAVVRKPRTQKMLEDEFVRRLEKRDTQATASYTIVSEGQKLDEAAWRKLISESHYDTVIVSRLVELDVYEKDVDPKFVTSDSFNGYGYYNSSYYAVYQPGFTIRKETAAIETRVFDAASQKLMWSAHSKTKLEQGRDPEAQIRDFVKKMLGKIYG